jgi:predicted DNA-binding transcriptional regulator YafY
LHSKKYFLYLPKYFKMPVNRNALIRYRTIDKCLQNRRRKWTIENLIDACNDALAEFESIEKGISMRTIRMDINAMRSDKLGYNAPIIVNDKKYYTYEDADYSIANSPLSSEDLSVLQEASLLLQQFKGFTHFADMNEMIQKLEDKIYSESNQQHSVIDFEKNDLLHGIHWLDTLYKVIIQKQTINIMYQSFKAREANEYITYPYLLKEYRNRWFLLAKHKKGNEIITFALDRIKDITINNKELFKEHRNFDALTFFKPIIGVTRNIGVTPIVITFIVNPYHAPYIKTKPLHHSQVLVQDTKQGSTFTIEVIPNFELEREILGFGDGIKIISPNSFLRSIKKRVQLMSLVYEN